MMAEPPVEFYTVGQLRAALEGVPDDRVIMAQVVAVDGSAWNMRATFMARIPAGNVAALTLEHPQLATLPTAL